MSIAGIMRKFRMTAIAAVDSPAQQGARMAIMKRDDESAIDGYMKRQFSDDKRKELADSGAALPDGSFPIENASDLENAIRAIGRAKDPAKAKAHIKSRAKALDLTDKIPDDWKKSAVAKALVDTLAKAGMISNPGAAESFADKFEDQLLLANLWQDYWKAQDALQQSIESIVKDDAVTDKAGMIRQSLDEFTGYVAALVPIDMANPFAAGLKAALTPVAKGDDLMTEAIAKALGLDAKATEADVLAKLAENDKVAKANEAIAKMSAKHKAFMDGSGKMPKGGKDAFAGMTPAERDKHIEDNPVTGDGGADEDVEKSIKKGDAFRTEDGTVISKADFGSEVAFQLAKNQAVKIAKQADEIAKSEDARLTAEFAKRAEPLAYIGKADEVGSLLHDVAKLDSKLADRVEAVLKVSNERLSKSDLFKEQGSGRGAGVGGGDMSKATGQIEALARDLISKEPALFKNAILDKMSSARAEIRKRNPELKKQEDAEKRTQRAAA